MSLASSAAGGPTHAAFTVTATFSEPMTGVAIGDFAVSAGTVGTLGGSGAVYTFTVTPPASSAGAITVDLAGGQATDLAGNAHTAATQLSQAYDTAAPSAPTITGITTDTGASAVDGATSDATLLYTGTAETDASVQLRINNSAVGAPVTATGGTWSVDRTGAALSDGIYSVTAVATDGAGNVSSASTVFTLRVITVPFSAPVVSGTTPTNSTTPIWTWSNPVSADFTTAEFKLDSSDFTSGATATVGTSFTPGSPLSAGIHTLYVRFADIAGNWSTLGSFPITIDLSLPDAPSVTVNPPGPSSNTQPTWTWIGGGGGNGTFRYKLDDPSMTSPSFGMSFTPGSPLDDGSHTLYVQEQNAASSWSSVGSATVVIDTVAPGVPVVSVASISGVRPTWSWVAVTGATQYRYLIDETTFPGAAVITADTSFTPAVDLPLGSHTLYVQAGDAAGNWSTTASAVTEVQAIATVGLSGLSFTYDGMPKAATVAVSPDVACHVTYNGSATLPSSAGSYDVIASVTQPGYSGTAMGTLIIAPAVLTITASNATRAYGAENPTFSGSITGLVAGDAITATYASSADATTPIGVYGPTTAEAISPTPVDPDAKLSNYALTTNKGTLSITAITATVTMASRSVIYDGMPHPLTAVTVPAGLATIITYDGSTEVPVKLGTYAVVATITDPGYTATPATASLTIRLAPDQEYPSSGGDSCGIGSGLAALLLGAFLALSSWLLPRRR